MNSLLAALKVMIVIAGGLALILGLALAMAPRAGSGLHGPLLRLVRWFDERRYIERYVYRHHRWFGAAIVAGAAAASYRLLHPATPTVLPADFPELILLGAVRFLWMANTLFILVGMVMLFRPSLLKGTEKWANRWITAGSQGSFDAFVRTSPRTAGMILATAGIYMLSFMLFG